MKDEDFEDFTVADLAGTGIQVTSPSGQVLTVLNEDEKEYYTNLVKRYQEDLNFQNVTDVQSLSLIVALETMIERWSRWLLSEKDYQGLPIVEDRIKKNIKEASVEVRMLKESLGIDRKTREKDHGETVADYILNLGIRAKKFGVMRNQQAVQAITLMNQVIAWVTFYEKSNDHERTEFNMHAENVIEKIKGLFPEFEAIDAEFRKNEQAYWIREM